MTARSAFLIGWALARTAQLTAKKVVWSDTEIGKEVRAKLLGKMEHESLLRLEDEVQTELVRRHKQNRKGEKEKR